MNTEKQAYGQQMSDRLRASAKAHARSALLHVTRVDNDERVRGAIDAGVAVEHMAKAFLSSLDPALIADRNADLDTMLHLTGLGILAKRGQYEVKTIGAHESCLRCAQIVPDFLYASGSNQTLFTARNGAAHLALASEEMLRESARIMTRLLEPLIKELGLDRSGFWGDMEQIADMLLDEKASQISAALEMKLAAARVRLEARLVGLGEPERALVLKVLSGPGSPFQSNEDEQHDCPACGQIGIVSCQIEDSGEPIDYDDRYPDGEPIRNGGTIEQVAYAVIFNCSVCGLELDYDEMIAADMETEYAREPREFDPWEFMERD